MHLSVMQEIHQTRTRIFPLVGALTGIMAILGQAA